MGTLHSVDQYLNIKLVDVQVSAVVAPALRSALVDERAHALLARSRLWMRRDIRSLSQSRTALFAARSFDTSKSPRARSTQSCYRTPRGKRTRRRRTRAP